MNPINDASGAARGTTELRGVLPAARRTNNGRCKSDSVTLHGRNSAARRAYSASTMRRTRSSMAATWAAAHACTSLG